MTSEHWNQSQIDTRSCIFEQLCLGSAWGEFWSKQMKQIFKYVETSIEWMVWSVLRRDLLDFSPCCRWFIFAWPHNTTLCPEVIPGAAFLNCFIWDQHGQVSKIIFEYFIRIFHSNSWNFNKMNVLVCPWLPSSCLYRWFDSWLSSHDKWNSQRTTMIGRSNLRLRSVQDRIEGEWHRKPTTMLGGSMT